jgi:hypothetical protein
MSKDFRKAAIAASVALGTPSVLLTPVAHAAANGATDVVSTAAGAGLASSASPDRASVQARAILLAVLSGMDPQQKRELAIDRIPAPNDSLSTKRVYELARCVLTCICTDCCISHGLPNKRQSLPNASPPKGQSPSNLSPPKMERSPGAKH